ncbi:Ras- protein Rab-4A [Ceratobasidium sp. 395]|nr:Ras- protein Rab-4A [Ceratobasidium sp. 395]
MANYEDGSATEMVEAYVKEHSQHTIGVEFSSRTINIGEKRVKLQLWDTAGQERFRSVTRSYYRGAAAALLVYDITSRASFLNLSRWLADARALASAQLVTVLVGNKTDREEDREVEWSEASKWAAENDVHFIETSSLTGDNIEKPFALAARAILLSIEGGQLDPEKASPVPPAFHHCLVPNPTFFLTSPAFYSPENLQTKQTLPMTHSEFYQTRPARAYPTATANSGESRPGAVSRFRWALFRLDRVVEGSGSWVIWSG